MKKIDRLILGTFWGPFLLTFGITLFIFVMQFLWKYIDDLVGKGLEWYIIVKLIFFASASFVPMVLPLAVLLSSIMTYGNLGEHYELVSLKAAGVSLTRFLAPLFITVIFISAGAFYFNNYMLPKANLKFGALLYDVRKQKPALNIKAGIFYSGIDGYSIRVGAKDPDNRTIYDVLIYDHNTGRGNDNVLIAKKGKMYMTPDNRFLVLELYEGSRYNDAPQSSHPSNEHYVTSFKEWKKMFDMSQFKMDKSDENNWQSHYQMMNIKQLSRAMDTLRQDIKRRDAEFAHNISQYYSFRRYIYDTVNTNHRGDTCMFRERLEELKGGGTKANQLVDIRMALNSARNVKSFAGVAGRDFSFQAKTLRRHDIEWHRKFTLSVACLVMFLIGAPLGSIIRMGGLGYPLLISIIFFVIFHVNTVMGEKLAEEGKLTPAQGMWMATGVLLPIGIFLVSKAMDDSPLFTWDWYYKLAKKYNFLGKLKLPS